MKTTLIFVCFLLLFQVTTASDQTKKQYGKYTLNGEVYEVTEDMLEAIQACCPAVAYALQDGNNVSVTTSWDGSWIVSGVEDQYYYTAYHEKYGVTYKDLRKESTIFMNKRRRKVYDDLRMLTKFDPRPYRMQEIERQIANRPAIKTYDCSSPRFLDYNIDSFGNKKLSAHAENYKIKKRIKHYLNLGQDKNTKVILYETFSNQEQALEYITTVRHILDSDSFKSRLETGKLTGNDMSILNSLGIFNPY